MTPPTPTLLPDQEEQLSQALLACHRARRLVTYADLAGELAFPPPHRIHKLTLALEKMIRADHETGKPLRATAAVSRAGEGLPGRGFFLLLAELGRYDDCLTDQRAAFLAELEAAQAFWGATGGSGHD
jgi:hypothetical protein